MCRSLVASPRRWLAGPARPGQTRTNHTAGHVRVGYDYVHAIIDDRSRRPPPRSRILRQLRHLED